MKAIRDLVVEATTGEPRHLQTIYAFVQAMRPAVARETIRARVYENVDAGRIVKVTDGVYLAREGPAVMVLVEGNAWEAIEKTEAGSLDLIVTDNAYDYGTAQNAGAGTTRPHARVGGRTYEQRDLDEPFLRAAFRALRKDHAWRNLATGEARPGGGALVIFTPKLTRQTRRHINALLDLAESIGFVYQGCTVWDKDSMGMGYAFGRSQVELLHLLTAGERGGVGWDLGMRDLLRFRSIRNKCAEGTEEHEAEKPGDLFLAIIRFCCRPGDVVMDPFAGRARWAREALREGFHVVLTDKAGEWLERIVVEDFGAGAMGTRTQSWFV